MLTITNCKNCFIMKTIYIVLFFLYFICYQVHAQTPNAEYFIDHDPGVGNGIPITGIVSADSIISNFNVSTAGLSAGRHLICFRVKGSNERWSIYDKLQFYVCTSIPTADFSTVNVCLGNPTIFTDLSTNTNANTVYSWDFTNNGVFDSNNPGSTNYTYSSAGTYTAKLRLTDTTGCSSEITHTVIVNPLPGAAGPITGQDTVCPGLANVGYTVPTISNAASYIWNLTSGAVITAGAGTKNITVNYSSLASSGLIYVTGQNSCGYGSTSILEIFVNPGYSFNENYEICFGDTFSWHGQNLTATGTFYDNHQTVIGCDSNYTLNLIVNPVYTSIENQDICFGTAYSWHGQTPTTSGTYYDNHQTVKGCDSTYTLNLIVYPLPDSAGTITGPDTVCKGQSGVIYCVPIDTNATSYTWYLPNGASIAAGGVTNCITVNFSSFANSGAISVYGANLCGTGATSTPLGVFVKPHSYTSIIVDSIIQPTCTLATGSVILCGLPSGNWTINPGNISGTDTCTTISNLTPGIYDFSYSDTIGCASGDTPGLYINSPPTQPATPIITLNGNILHSNAASGNQWYDQNGPISGAAGQNYTVVADGYYYDIVTLSGCSSDTSVILHVIVSGIEQSESSNIRIYLNPSSDIVFVNNLPRYQKCIVTVFDALGKKVKQAEFSKNQQIEVPVYDLNNGLYLVEVKMNDNNAVTQKIMKK